MRDPAVGIDLGTTYSVVAFLDPTGRPQTILNAEGDLTTPSVVLFDRSSVVVGKEAVKAASLEPDCIAEFAKREMGCPTYSKTIHDERFPPEVIQSFILEKLKADAEQRLGPFQKAVITVPAYFNEPRRKAVQDAGHLAGLEVLDIINEPTALTFGVQRGFLKRDGTAHSNEKILVYDLGGGTFDVTLMEIRGDTYTTLATAGDVYLGGVDWDRRLVDHLAEAFKAKYRFDLRKHPGACQRLMQAVEDAKQTLTARQETTILFDHSGDAIRLPVARAEFELMTADLLERTRVTVRGVLKDARLQWSDITRVLLVGGSTRMPMVQRMLREESGKELDCSLSAAEAVAHGAAIYAGLLLRGENALGHAIRVQNVNSHDLGVLGFELATGRPRRKVMIARNTPLPAKRESRFATHRDNQPDVLINIVEGGDDTGQNATHIGTCVVRDLPPGLPKGTPVRVVFAYAANGRLDVYAHLPTVGSTAALTLERTSGLNNRTLDEWQDRLSRRRRPMKLNSVSE